MARGEAIATVGTPNPLEKANAEQRAASNPAVSAFVAASAGTGKTKLLTDRLLRLMLDGTDPARILCLTYTRAAAAEMTIRLNRRLGHWVAMPARALDAELQVLDIVPSAEMRLRARRLFGDVLDLPGGMRIDTIHAFCQSLLRRFPLEAGLSPHFMLEDAAEATARLREAREQSLALPEHQSAVAALAGEIDEQAFAAAIATLNADDRLRELLRSHGVAEIAQRQAEAVQAPAADVLEVLRRAVCWPREAQLHVVLGRIAEAGSNSGRNWAVNCLAWLARDAEARLLSWVEWVEAHFTQSGSRRKMGGFTGAGLRAEEELLHAELELEHARIEQMEDALRAAGFAALNRQLLQLAAPILRGNSDARAEQAELTYSDLIARTGALLQDPGAAWILYKLDGGIDHLLLDEVQDTAPAQWQIANAIAEEFFAGQGAVERPRSIFAVGDAKQSIFSFQGADLRSFETNRERFRSRVRDARQDWLDGELSVSFRSTAPVLRLVDAVFSAGPARDGVVAPGAVLSHEVSRAGQAGQVTLWPLSEPREAPVLPPWEVPDRYASEESAQTVLARAIARHVSEALAGQHVLPSRGRPIRAGDILILIRRRDALVGAMTRELKKLGLPVAGADRLVLTSAQAVSDLLALCDALLLPEDDLAFAQFLVSPLGGLSDESLMQLAQGRPTRLSAALAARHAERPDWAAAQGFFSALWARADFIPPYALLMEALGPLGGRARLLARLGEEAAEPIDELLAEALEFAAREPGSLQKFVFAVREAGAEIKREAEAGGEVIRIMTVHGAKGLQAPLVILPDTVGLPQFTDKLFWLAAGQGREVPLYGFTKDGQPRAIAEAVNRERAAKLEEYNRLLYVALTRAEDELLICGAKPARALPEACWYESIRRGFDALEVPAGPDGVRLMATPQTAPPDRAGGLEAAVSLPDLPAWAGAAPDWLAVPPRLETARPEPLAPSRNTEDEAKRAIAASPLGQMLRGLREARAAALAKGRMVHALLQHLPEIAQGARVAAADSYLAHAARELPAPVRARIRQSVMNILEDERLAPLFGPGSRAEAPIAGVVAGFEIGGLIDRLAIGEAEILLADYKTDRAPPPAPEHIPPGYLRQLAAYRALLSQIHPTHQIKCILIWTESAVPMEVPSELLDAHAPQAEAVQAEMG